MVGTRWGALPPERKRAVVRASVLLIGLALSLLGILGGENLTMLLLPGAASVLLAAHTDIFSLGGILPFHETSPKLKVWYVLSWLVMWPVYLLVIFIQGCRVVVREWQSAPALTSARIAELEKELARPTGE